MLARTAAVLVLIATTLVPTTAQSGSSVGKSVADFRLPDHFGKDHALAEFADRDLVVVAFLGTQCPLAKLYAGRLQAIADEYAERGVAVVAVMSNAQDSLTEIAAYVRQHNITYPVLKDRRNEVADQFAAERTPQVFLLDRERVVRYQGRIDDQYLVGVVRDKPTREDLRAAIDELLAGKPVSVPQTESLGCIIGRAREPKRRQPGHVRARHRADLASALRRVPPHGPDRAVRAHVVRRSGRLGRDDCRSRSRSADAALACRSQARLVRQRSQHARGRERS